MSYKKIQVSQEKKKHIYEVKDALINYMRESFIMYTYIKSPLCTLPPSPFIHSISIYQEPSIYILI